MDRARSLPVEFLCHTLSFLTTKAVALTSVLSKSWRILLAFVPHIDIDDSVFLHPEEEKMDHVSSLPDESLCHILSFLTTKEAALTSVLAKRWRNLLAFVPYLNIDDSVFLHPEEGKKDRREIIQSFMDFVDRILALQGNSPIKKFSLKCVTEVDSDRVDGWISNVLGRGVLDLDLLVFLEGDNYRLSPKCFESKTLVKLKVNHGVEIGWLAGTIFLPMLKTLVIDAAYVDKLEILLPALPALEELVLNDVFWKDWNVSVSSASLRTLTINSTFGIRTLSLDTPNLVYFCYSDDVETDYPLVKVENLVEARIHLLVTEDEIQRARAPHNDLLEDDEDDVVHPFHNVGKLMNGIRNVQYLDLCPDTLEGLSLCCESMPVFNNLKSLGIKSDMERGWQAMPVLLRNCPHLELLVIEGLLHDETDKCGDACNCISREDKGRSLASCPVKLLKIQGFRGTMKEMAIIKHFLDYFPCLKEMGIFVEENERTELRVPDVSKRIMQMIEDYNKLSSCNVQLLVSDYLYKKWTAKRSL